MAITMAQALNTALHDAMAADDKVVMFGEDVGTLGGGVPHHRQAPGALRRQALLRHAAGRVRHRRLGGRMALYGYKPVVEMQFDGFTYPAFEQIVSHVAKMRNRSRGP